MVKLIMELNDKSIDELKPILENIDSLELIEYINLLNRKSRKLFYEKIEIILGKKYVNMLKLSLLKKLNNNKIILIITSSILFLEFILYPLSEKITYIEMIKERFFSLAYLYPIFIFKFLNNFWLVIPMLLIIILINKKRKLFPYLIFYILFLIIHLFIGLLIFGLRKGGM